MQVKFSVNQYDSDGDCFDECVLLQLDNGILLRFNGIEELKEFVDKTNKCIAEIERDCL